MSFPKYPHYKTTGINWLDRVPEHWQIVPIKRVAELNPTKQTVHLESSEQCSFLPMEKLKTDSVTLDECRVVGEVGASYTGFSEGDILMAKVTPCFENRNIAIACGLVNGIGFGSSEICVFRATDAMKNRFLFYRLQEGTLMELWTSEMTGAGGLKRVPTNIMRSFQIAVPEPCEQTQIAHFLDHETAKIDALIREQERLIELLDEKRQAVISHAVTKGLDPDVPMKDSGVEWLGEVPAHWETARIKHAANYITSGPRGWSELITDAGDAVFLQSGDLNDDLGVDTENAKRVVAPSRAEGTRTRLKVQDVLVCITGANTGRVAVVDRLGTTTFINQHLALVRPVSTRCQSLYMGFSLASTVGQTYFNLSQYGLKEGLNLSNVGEAPLFLPPLTEQAEIVEYIIEATNQIDGLKHHAAKAINVLAERRSALISAAVTGKIDVRNWQPPKGSAFDGAAETTKEATA